MTEAVKRKALTVFDTRCDIHFRSLVHQTGKKSAVQQEDECPVSSVLRNVQTATSRAEHEIARAHAAKEKDMGKGEGRGKGWGTFTIRDSDKGYGNEARRCGIFWASSFAA